MYTISIYLNVHNNPTLLIFQMRKKKRFLSDSPTIPVTETEQGFECVSPRPKSLYFPDIPRAGVRSGQSLGRVRAELWKGTGDTAGAGDTCPWLISHSSKVCHGAATGQKFRKWPEIRHWLLLNMHRPHPRAISPQSAG